MFVVTRVVIAMIVEFQHLYFYTNNSLHTPGTKSSLHTPGTNHGTGSPPPQSGSSIGTGGADEAAAPLSAASASHQSGGLVSSRFVKISHPVSVTSNVCSNCADGSPSFVTAVQPSNQWVSFHEPMFTIGSMVKMWPGFITNFALLPASAQ